MQDSLDIFEEITELISYFTYFPKQVCVPAAAGISALLPREQLLGSRVRR